MLQMSGADTGTTVCRRQDWTHLRLQLTLTGLPRRVLKPGNPGLDGSLPSSLPYPLLMATSEGPYQPITSGTLGAPGTLTLTLTLA